MNIVKYIELGETSKARDLVFQQLKEAATSSLETKKIEVAKTITVGPLKIK